MSLSTITAATQDQALNNRVAASLAQEAWNNPNVAATAFAATVKESPLGSVDAVIWPLASDYEAEYASALAAGNPDPGGDPAVITDGNITAAVQAHWPPD